MTYDKAAVLHEALAVALGAKGYTPEYRLASAELAKSLIKIAENMSGPNPSYLQV